MPREIQLWRDVGTTTSQEALSTSFGDGLWNGHTGVEREMAPKSRRFQSGHTQGMSGERRPNCVERKQRQTSVVHSSGTVGVMGTQSVGEERRQGRGGLHISFP
jgi:hypothetical protein